MKYRTLGRTNLNVAEVGMGTWQLANDPGMWVGSDLGESLKSLYKYVELGGNFIDTAWIYGYSDQDPQRHPSEELIGQFLKESGKRKDVIIASKVPGKNMEWPAKSGVPVQEVFPGEWIEKCVDDSLRSLSVDSIDLMQLHVWQDDFVGQGDWAEVIQRITKTGKVKHWGASVNDYQPSNCLKALDTDLFSTVQFIFNVFHQKPIEKLLPYAKQKNIGLIARVPMDEGGLSGKITLDTKFPSGDLRGNYFGGDRLGKLVAKVDELKKLAGKEFNSMPELALRYILSHDAISTVIPGMRKVEHVEMNTNISDGRSLSSTLMEELKKHVWERNFYMHPDVTPEGAEYVEK